MLRKCVTSPYARRSLFPASVEHEESKTWWFLQICANTTADISSQGRLPSWYLCWFLSWNTDKEQGFLNSPFLSTHRQQLRRVGLLALTKEELTAPLQEAWGQIRHQSESHLVYNVHYSRHPRTAVASMMPLSRHNKTMSIHNKMIVYHSPSRAWNTAWKTCVPPEPRYHSDKDMRKEWKPAPEVPFPAWVTKCDLFLTEMVILIFKHEFPPHPIILRQTIWISGVCVILPSCPVGRFRPPWDPPGKEAERRTQPLLGGHSTFLHRHKSLWSPWKLLLAQLKGP